MAKYACPEESRHRGPDQPTGSGGLSQPTGGDPGKDGGVVDATQEERPGCFSVLRMARLLRVSTSGFSAWRKRCTTTVPIQRQQRRADLSVKIRAIHGESDGTYGSPRITGELRDRGEVVNEKTVAAIMAEIGIEGISPRTFKVRTTVQDPHASFPPDLIERQFDQGRLNVAWFTEITYLTCGEGDMFLCAIRDAHSRRVLGYAVDDHFDAPMVERAIDDAVATRALDGVTVAGTILHSDRGGEFTGSVTVRACARHKLERSMGETGICWDNAATESFWSTFKHEYYYRRIFATKTELVAGADKWIRWFNHERRHSGAGGLSPIRYEQTLTGTATAA
jgi:putative transposase